MPYDKRRANAALAEFQKATGLKDFPWEKAAGLGEGTLRRFRSGGTRSMSTETYEKLAAGASKLKGRPFTAAEIRGEAEVGAHEVPLNHYVGAGDEIHPIEDDGPLDYVEGPPGYDKGAAVIVRGDSMRPTFDPGDMLFYRRREPPPTRELPQRPVIVQVKNGPLYVKKLLPGTRRGRYHLLSVNPLTPTLQDQLVESIARIGWIKRAAE